MNKAIKIANVTKQCVACGCCASACPKNAIQIFKGIIAQIDAEKCVGCGKCAGICPAGVITITKREAK